MWGTKVKMWGFVYESVLETVLPLHKERFVFPFKCYCCIRKCLSFLLSVHATSWIIKGWTCGALFRCFRRFRQVCSIFWQFGLVGICWTSARVGNVSFLQQCVWNVRPFTENLTLWVKLTMWVPMGALWRTGTVGRGPTGRGKEAWGEGWRGARKGISTRVVTERMK